MTRNNETGLFFTLACGLIALMLIYTQRAERHAHCMIECMGNEHTESAYLACAAEYDTYTNDYCEPLM